ncbi:hypothetical protein Lfu02_45930 [Longispora fulva]|uniref:ATP-grasp domain-containing protein n=1 Tax=Longispora fulva TaxID=619741 RepID=A0A8J7GT85_9ACTN|nr:ATP-grasp domain-containing protein [Longispora fulva]MBG6137968.1 hypothetical protein [Longispora fulva]GIG60221.1 hypothetical protein Lfu02_45930 [Longispora fulva]
MATTMVFPPRLTASAEQIRVAAGNRGLTPVQLGPDWRLPADLLGRVVHLHAGPTFADAVRAGVDVAPLEAPPGWLAGLPQEFLRREVRLIPISEAHTLRRPVFAKSPNDKSITAMVYSDGTRLPGSDAVDPFTPVLVSDPVDVVAEFRLHVLDGAVRTGSQYGDDGVLRMASLAGHPREAEVRAFAADLLADQAAALPSAIVLDVGTVRPLSGGPAGWAVIEANAAWAAGCYEADVDSALDVILRAAGPSEDLSDHDRRFVRPPG